MDIEDGGKRAAPKVLDLVFFLACVPVDVDEAVAAIPPDSLLSEANNCRVAMGKLLLLTHAVERRVIGK